MESVGSLMGICVFIARIRVFFVEGERGGAFCSYWSGLRRGLVMTEVGICRGRFMNGRRHIVFESLLI